MPQIPRERAASPVAENRPRGSWAAEPGHTVASRETDHGFSLLLSWHHEWLFWRKIHFILQDDSMEEPGYEASMHVHIKMG